MPFCGNWQSKMNEKKKNEQHEQPDMPDAPRPHLITGPSHHIQTFFMHSCHPQGEIIWDELNDDPATRACRELLEQLEETHARVSFFQ